MKIVVIGDAMIDRYETVEVNRISQEAPVPIGLSLSREDRLGGAANVAHNIKVIDPSSEVTLYSVFGGNDNEGNGLSELIAQAGLLDGMYKDAGRCTTVKTRFVDSSGHQMFRFDRETLKPVPCAWLQVFHAAAPFLVKADRIVVSDYSKGAIDEETAGWLSENWGEKMTVNCKPEHAFGYYGADTFVFNEAEARVFAPGDLITPRGLAQKLGASNVVITRGEHGMEAFSGGNFDHLVVPAHPVEVFDVSGAGDTVLAVLALRGVSPDTLHGAALAAANVVRQRGTAVPQ